MNVLLDTCVFLWLSMEPAKLSFAAMEALTHPNNAVFLSSASAWEISIKFGKGQLILDLPPRIFVPMHCELQKIEILPIDAMSALKTNDLPTIHKDPFDRILVCQAMNHDMTLLTADPEKSEFRLFNSF